MSEVKNKFIIIRVTEDVKESIIKLAKKSNQSISDYLRGVIEKL